MTARRLALPLLVAVAALAPALPAGAEQREQVRVRVLIPATNTGTGEVNGVGFSCPGDCFENVEAGTPVTLTGKPDANSKLTWGGACEGTPGEQPCVLTPTRFAKVQAIFTKTGGGGGGAGSAPETTITKAPKKKVRTARGKARVKFKFAADRPGASFECRLDREPFKACFSPRKLKVRPGKHTFAVRAITGANTDPSPATARFKVVKKKRR